MTTDAQTPELPPFLARVVQAILAVTALTGLAAAALAVLASQWFTLGFEVVVIATVVLGVLAAGGRPPYAQPLALACVAGLVAVASFLEAVGVDRSFLGVLGRPLATLRGPGVSVQLDVLLAFRFGVGATLIAVAGFVLMRRDWPRSVRRLGIGLGLAGAGLAILGAAWLGRGVIGGLIGPVKWTLALMGFLLITGLLAAGAQYLIDAFSARRDAS